METRNLKIWLDDVRHLPTGYHFWVKTTTEMMKLLNEGRVVHISFDHDLGDNGGNHADAYVVALAIELRALEGIEPPTWDVHSANPVGRERIDAAMNSAMRLWKEFNEKRNTKIEKETV